MDFPYLLSPAMNLVWLIFGMATALAIVSWRKRRQVGALPLFFAGSASMVWAFALGAEFVALNPDTQSTWYAIRSTMLWPLSFSLTGFVFEYAGLKRFLRRPVVIAMLVVIFAHAILAFTNDWHGLMWRDLTRRHDGLHAGSLGVAAWGLFWANIGLMLLDLGVLNRKFIRSPSSRRMLWLIFPAILFARLAYSFDVMQHRWDTLGQPALAAVGIPLFLYLVAIFRMRLFDPVPSAQATAVAQLRDAVLVVSPTPRRIAYANPAAARLLGRSADDLVDQPIGEVLPAELMDAPVTESDTVAAGRASVRHRVLADREVVAESTDLVDSLGTQVGQLIVVRDVTEQNRAFARELDQERAMAALSERDHLAREMHDTVGQVLAYVSMQSQAADKLLRAGEVDRARDLLGQLTAVAQNAHDGVRATIATLKGTSDADWHFRGRCESTSTTSPTPRASMSSCRSIRTSRSTCSTPRRGCRCFGLCRRPLSMRCATGGLDWSRW